MADIAQILLKKYDKLNYKLCCLSNNSVTSVNGLNGDIVLSSLDNSVTITPGIDGIIDLATSGSGGSSSATNGLSVSGSDITLGQNVGESGNPAILTSVREIPTNGKGIVFSKLEGTAQTNPVLNLDLKHTPGSILEYIRFNNPKGTTPGTPFQFANSVNLNSDGTYNNVVSWGFNIFKNYDTNQPSLRYAIEPHWVTGGALYHEFHQPEIILPNGENARLMSGTFVNRGTLALSDMTWELRQTALNLSTPDNKSFMGVGTNRSTDTTQFSLLTPNTGKGISLTMQTTGLDYQPVGFTSHVGKQINFSAFDRIILPFINTSTNDGYVHVTGDLYNSNSKKIYGWNWVSAGQVGANKGYFSANPGAGIHNWVARGNVEITNNDSDAAKLALVNYADNFTTHRFRIYYNGQVIIGNGTADTSSTFEVKSTTKGSTPFPLMTSAERLAISSPGIGLHVYQTDGTEGVYVNKSGGWVFAY